MDTILDLFDKRVAEHPDRVAIVGPTGRRLSYAALDRRALALAAGWAAAGIRRGDRVLIATRLDGDLYAALAALWRLGATAVFPEPQLGLGGLRHAAAATAPEWLLPKLVVRLARLWVPELRRLPTLGFRHRDVDPAAAQRHLPAARHPPGATAATGTASTPAVAVAEAATRRAATATTAGSAAATDDRPHDDAPPALISFTSGTTGRPKAIARSHAFLLAQLHAVAPLLARERPAVDLVGFPAFVLAELALGHTAVLPPWPLSRQHRARPHAVRAYAEGHGAERLLLPPALAHRLAREAWPGGVDTLFTGGAPLFPAELADIVAAAPGTRVTMVYGSTEAEPIAHIDAADIADDDRGRMAAGDGLLAGPPVEAIDLRLAADGEIEVSGPHVVAGYLDPADDTATKRREGGRIWHRTGDGGRLDDRGRLWLTGRIAARAGGLEPFRIEIAARSWPGVRAAVLLPMGDRPVLAIEGDRRHLPEWRTAAARLGAIAVRPVRRIPMDRRHRSKPDYVRLAALLRM